MKSLTSTIFLLIPTLFVGCASLQSGIANHTTVPDVEKRVDSALPIGSTRQEIEAWLTERGIEYSYSEVPFLGNTTATGCSLQDVENRAGGTIEGIIRTTQLSLLGTGDIQLLFVLSKDNQLTDRWVKWVSTSR